MNIALPLADFLLACRYAYYVLGQSILPDTEYDALEAHWLGDASDSGCVGHPDKHFNPSHPLCFPGSDRKEDYPPHIRALAIYYLLRHGKKVTDEFDFGVD